MLRLIPIKLLNHRARSQTLWVVRTTAMKLGVLVPSAHYVLLMDFIRHPQMPALTQAVALARCSGVYLRVLAFGHKQLPSVTDSFHPGSSSSADGEWDDSRIQFERQIENERVQGVDISVYYIHANRPFGAIKRYLTEHSAELLIKDIHHGSTTLGLVTSSLDLLLSRETLCPILYVTDTPRALPHRILAAVNLYRLNDADLRLNEHILGTSATLARQCHASLHVVYVYDWPAIYSAGATLFGTQPVESGFEEALSDALKEMLMTLCACYDVPADHRYFLTGAPRGLIEAFARQYDFDTLVLGALPARGVGKIIEGTAQPLLMHAPCNTLIVKGWASDAELKPGEVPIHSAYNGAQPL